ncbi:MAG: sodium/proton-translocating pyrophosphatase, partial [Bacillota bacterium]
GAVMGLCVIGLGLLGIGGVFVVLGLKTASVITGFGLGASSAAFVGRAVSGIYKKAADAGAVIVEKAEGAISEGDPRNPLAIAGHGGDYVNHTTGMGSDLFESYAGAIIAAILIAAATKSIDPAFGYPFDLPALQGSVFPLTISAAGILAAITGIMFVRGNEKSNLTSAINTGKYLCYTIAAIFSFIISWAFFGNLNCAVSILIGMLIGAVNGKVTDIYTSGNSRHLKKIAEQSQTGYLMISEYGIGMLSVLWPIIFLAAGILAANAFAGFYGIALAAAGLLTTTGMITAIDAFGPVSGNAGEIARMARLSDEDRIIMDQLTSAGRANAAAGKGFAIGAAALTALALIVSYALITDLKTISLLKPVVVAGLFLGAMLPVLFSAMTMNATGNTTYKLVEDVKGQFHSDAGILTGTSRPDYAKCADTGTKAALKGIIAPGMMAVIAPLAVGIFMGTEALGGLLAGALTSGVLTAIILSNTGGVWNHAQKFTTGDPFKDAAGYSINVFIKLMVMVSVVFAPLLVSIGGLL